jgi:hypothetical protein
MQKIRTVSRLGQFLASREIAGYLTVIVDDWEIPSFN